MPNHSSFPPISEAVPSTEILSSPEQITIRLPNPLRQDQATNNPSTTQPVIMNARERRRQNRTIVRNLSPSRLARRLHPLGTIEDVQREDYESPIAGMFGRAWNRFRDAEETRTAAREAGVVEEVDDEDIEIITRSETVVANPFYRSTMPIRSRSSFHRQFYGMRQENNPTSRAQRSLLQNLNPVTSDHHDELPVIPEDPRNAIDRQTRGPSRPTEDLMVNFSCKICLEQRISILCEPCMHAVMCTWCSQLYRQECYRVDGRFDPRLWTCPICRAPITQCRKFYLE